MRKCSVLQSSHSQTRRPDILSYMDSSSVGVHSHCTSTLVHTYYTHTPHTHIRLLSHTQRIPCLHRTSMGISEESKGCGLSFPCRESLEHELWAPSNTKASLQSHSLLHLLKALRGMYTMCPSNDPSTHLSFSTMRLNHQETEID